MVPLLTVLVVVWRLKVAETVDLVVTVLSCEADFKEVWDVDFFILGGGCNDKGIYYKNVTSNKLHGLLRYKNKQTTKSKQNQLLGMPYG